MPPRTSLMTPVPSESPSLYWSSGLLLERKLLCIGPIGENTLVSSRLPLLPFGQNPHCFSLPDAMHILLPGPGVLGWGSWNGDENVHSSWGIFTAEISLWLLHCMWVQG